MDESLSWSQHALTENTFDLITHWLAVEWYHEQSYSLIKIPKSSTRDWANHVGSLSGLITNVVVTLFLVCLLQWGREIRWISESSCRPSRRFNLERSAARLVRRRGQLLFLTFLFSSLQRSVAKCLWLSVFYHRRWGFELHIGHKLANQASSSPSDEDKLVTAVLWHQQR